MSNKFGIMYDLRQDLHHNNAVKHLKTISLIFIIPRFFKPEILKKYSLIYHEETDSNRKIEWTVSKKVWESIESQVVEAASKFFKVPLQREIAEVTHFIGSQIFLFLTKNHYSINDIYILKNLVFNWQGTINMENTIQRVLQLSNIPVTEKFETVCRNFMSEDVINQYFLLSPLDSLTTYLGENPMVKRNIPIYFWVCRFTGSRKTIDLSDLRNVIGENKIINFSNENNFSTIECFFYWSFFSYNDMAVQFLWERYISQARGRDRIVNVIFSNLNSDFRMVNSVIYLLSKISDREIKMIFPLYSTTIFEFILLDLRWQTLFSQVLEVLHEEFWDNIYIDIFKFIIYILCSNIKDKFDKCVLKEFLIKMPISVKRIILNDKCFFLRDMIPKLYDLNDLESCSIVLTILGPLDANSVFITNSDITFFDSLLFSGKSTIVDSILEYSLNTATAIKYFKNTFYSKKACGICQYLITFHYWKSLNWFLNWVLTFKSQEDISELKLDILIAEDGKFLRKIIFNDREEDDDVFQNVDKILEWCLGSQDLVTNFKKCIIMIRKIENNEDSLDLFQINIYPEIKYCIKKNQEKFLTRLFKWKK
ncbi:UNVERIFIED_CONTAM: hypothetical protein RMT77_018347 [Armadillidium vulgare]